MAVKASYHVAETVSNPLIVADNFVMAAIFVLLLWIAASRWFCERFARSPDAVACEGQENATANHWQRKGISLLDVAWCFAFAFTAFGLSSMFGRLLVQAFGDTSHAGWGRQMLAVLCTNKFVLITAVTLVLATLLARPLAKVNGADEFGTYMLSVFLFSLGLPADLMAVVTKAPLFFVFCGIIAFTNLGFTLGVGKLLRLNLEELLLSVNANLGGAPSAAAMATSAGWPRLVLPGILMGIWGYVIGTPIGVMVVEWFKR
jgi:uncharacterized membrane protein